MWEHVIKTLHPGVKVVRIDVQSLTSEELKAEVKRAEEEDYMLVVDNMPQNEEFARQQFEKWKWLTPEKLDEMAKENTKRLAQLN